MASLAAELSRFVAAELRKVADPAKAGPMQAYMKTDMPFHGVQNPAQTPIFREMNRRFPPQSRREYEAGVRALWRLPHREEKYAAIVYACRHKQFITAASLPLYEKLVRRGAWWDFVDPIAMLLVGQTLLTERDAVRSVVECWIDDPDLWIRRTALLAHNHHKQATDRRQLFDHCLRRAAEPEFFIRKAIGWALREYSYTNPQAVRRYLLAHRAQLSPLSFREAAKGLIRAGVPM